jgi:hypothetical protein
MDACGAEPLATTCGNRFEITVGRHVGAASVLRPRISHFCNTTPTGDGLRSLLVPCQVTLS